MCQGLDQFPEVPAEIKNRLEAAYEKEGLVVEFYGGAWDQFYWEIRINGNEFDRLTPDEFQTKKMDLKLRHQL